MSKKVIKQADRLQELAERWRLSDDGRYRVVPVVGSGLNIEAAKDTKAKEDDWSGLLTRVAKECRISRSRVRSLPASFIQQWETAVRWYTVDRWGYQPFKGEEYLQKVVREFLRDREPTTSSWPLFKRFVDAGFYDIISLNFDRRMALSCGSKRIMGAGVKVALHKQSLYRHSVVKAKNGRVRIWYPHGDTSQYKTIRLGVRWYGMYIASMDEARGRYMQHWYECYDDYKRQGGTHWALPTDTWDDIVRQWNENRNWVNVFLSAPLLFIGCGLGHDEWTLWWLLNQRARHTAYLDQRNASPRPETIVLTAGRGGPPAQLARMPCYIENLHFASFRNMWTALHKCLL